MLLVLLLAAVAVAWIQLTGDLDRQARYLRTFIVLSVAGMLLALLCLVQFPRTWRARGLWLGGLAVVIGLLTAIFRIEGVTGDLVPILKPRWAARPAASAPTPAPAPAVALPAEAPAATPAWPQFLGPDRNGLLPGPALARDWREAAPTELWRIRVGPAWSGFAIAEGIAVTQEQDGPQELVTAYDAATGQPLWRKNYEARYATTIAGEGPRATPTITGGRVYAVGATGWLHCLELRTGAPVWARNILEENGGGVPEWGMSASPLLLEEVVVVPAGGGNGRSLVGYARDTGAFAWGGGDDPLAYSSPVLRSLGGVPQILLFNGRAVTGHAPSNGRVLWRHPWSSPHPKVANPVVTGPDTLVASAGYGQGAEALQIKPGANDTWTVTRLWKSNRLKAKFSNFIAHDGHLYGLDDGIFTCLDAASGAQLWKEGRYGHGQFMLVGDVILLLAESGDLVLIDPQPTELRELSRSRVFVNKTWNSPALAGDLAYLRNDREAVCLRLPLAK